MKKIKEFFEDYGGIIFVGCILPIVWIIFMVIECLNKMI